MAKIGNDVGKCNVLSEISCKFASISKIAIQQKYASRSEQGITESIYSELVLHQECCQESEHHCRRLELRKVDTIRGQSHKIVGWAVGPTLETIYPLEALKMALATIDEDTAGRLIHHSDRGCQYCSDAYVAELKAHGISISMTQSGDSLENAVAERANGRRDELSIILQKLDLL